MARGGRSSLQLDDRSVDKVLKVVMDRVERGTKKATIEAVRSIYEDSLSMVPRDTNTLAASAYYEVKGNSKVGFTGHVGYGGKGNPTNPKHGRTASSYMIEVHEDLETPHKVGSAKFLEIPVRRFQETAGARLSNILRKELQIIQLLRDLKSYIVANTDIESKIISVDAMGEEPELAVALYEYEGVSPIPQITSVTRPVQVVVRSKSASQAHKLSSDIYKSLLTENGIINLTVDRWSAINLRQVPFKFKTDEAGRVYYCFNLSLTTYIDQEVIYKWLE